MPFLGVNIATNPAANTACGSSTSELHMSIFHPGKRKGKERKGKERKEKKRKEKGKERKETLFCQ